MKKQITVRKSTNKKENNIMKKKTTVRKSTNKKAAPIAITYNRKLKKMQYDNITILTSYVRPEIMAVILKTLPSRIVRTKVYPVTIIMPASGKKQSYNVSVI